jgi:colanic acid/amylovoran biosynthesis protein
MLTRFDVVVATRMHMAILSLCAAVPVIAIAYEFKTRELFSKLGIQCYACDINSLTADSLISVFECLMRELGTSLKPLLDAVRQEGQSACSTVELLRAVVRLEHGTGCEGTYVT